MINVCRTCGEVTRTIYTQFLYDDQKKVLLHQIEILTGLWLGYNDIMPSSICAYCVQELKLAVAFRERCIKVQVKLHRQFTKDSELKKLIRYTDTPREFSQINRDPLVMVNSIASEGNEEINIDDEIYGDLAASTYEEIEDETDVEDEGHSCEYESYFDDWVDHFLNSEDDQEHDVESNIEEADKLNSEELHAQEQLISTTVNTEKTCYQSEMLNKNINKQKCKLRNRSARQGINNNNDGLQLKEQHLEDDCHIIETQSRERNEHLTYRQTEKTDIEPDVKNIPAGKTKRKYTFIIRKPASIEKKEYNPTRSGYVCEICGKCYSKLFTFSEHKLLHTGIKSFKCTECPKTFFTKRLLKQHVIKHTDERPFVCRICSLTFRSRAHRNDHEKKHLNPLPWACRQCGKKLTTSYARDLHEAAHRGVRKHHCETCDRGFITRKHLMSHKQTKLHKRNLERVKPEIVESDTVILE